MNWKSLLRRSAALSLSVVVLYLTVLTGGAAASADALSALGAQRNLVLALVQSELAALRTLPSERETHTADFTLWQHLVVGQSALLRSGLPSAADEPVEQTPPPPAPEQTPLQTFPADCFDPEDPAEETPVTPGEGESIVPRQILPSAGQENAGGVYLFNRTSKNIDMPSIIAAACPVRIANIDTPQVLIVHTHGSEAYRPTSQHSYEPSDPYRTLDNEHNITRIGAEVKTVLEGLGVSVLHDRTLHDYPNYNGSYTRSAETIRNYLNEYPSIQIVLDIHRDALIGDDGTVYKPLTVVDGEDVAQVLLIVGTDEGGQQHDNWVQNLVFAGKVQSAMNLLYPTLARPVTLRTSRFNQQYRVGSLLVEMGSHGNTLEESLAAARHFARALGLVLLQNKAP